MQHKQIYHLFGEVYTL